MQFTVVIPSRFGSSRLPGKPLETIHNKSMVEHVVARSLVSKANRTFVATDHDGIADVCRKAGAEVCMTASCHESGTSRLAEVVDCFAFADDEIIVNVQGDEPLIPPALIDRLAQFLASSAAEVATIAVPIYNERDATDPNVVKTVLDRHGRALYFSRASIPFDRDQTLSNRPGSTGIHLRHVGIYAYRAGFLRRYDSWEPSQLEKVESLEQLRILWYGYSIAVCVVETDSGVSIDSREDLERVRQFDKALFTV